MNKAKILFGALALLPLSLSVSSCGLLGTNEPLAIAEIQVDDQDDGSILVTIIMNDDDVAPIRFVIPKGTTGDSGKDGNGIASIEVEPSEDGTALVVKVNYTDNTIPSSKFEIPNANSIVGFDTVADPMTGMTTVIIETSDGEKHTFQVPSGQDGRGIASVTQSEGEGSIVITINYTDGTNSKIYLPYKNGEDGRGISYIESSYDETTYYVTVYFTEGDPQTLSFPMPEVKDGTQWFDGDGYPYNVLGAQDGDYYFDYTNGAIYQYYGGYWGDPLFQLGEDITYHTVEFDATTNGGRIVNTTGMVGSTIRVKSGDSIANLPDAEKSGATFIGWYTNQLGPSFATSGKLTDLTPITRSLTVYACFEEGNV